MKKKILCWFLAAMLAVPTTVMAADEKQTELSENQRKATIMVLSISGNELTYIEIDTGDEDSAESESEEMTESESEEMTESESEEMTESESEEMTESESEETSEPADSAEVASFDGERGGPGEGGQMFRMGDMEDILEALQESGIDTSQMGDIGEILEALQESGIDTSQMEDIGEMPEAFQESGPGMPGMEDMEDMPEAFQGSDIDMSQMGDNMEEMLEALQESGIDTSRMEEMMGSFMENGGDMSGERPDMSQIENMGDMRESFLGNGGQMPQMGNIEDMLETFQDSGIDMSQMEEMMESFMGNIGGMSGAGDGMTWMGNNLEGSSEEFDSSMAGSVTVYLQVGVVVHADDKEMTFSILEAGDELEVLFEADDDGNEYITEMWLL